ncbi:hypothetical protein [uncultured Propionivibrio sp.]|uniref:hypothetical protein n=1 Tax=uncultured Propionivibrio sp. TaxID=426737 RepID=UPI0029C0FE70|nr:hypothetical protein [uncultured Propionivibrio sp.]
MTLSIVRRLSAMIGLSILSLLMVGINVASQASSQTAEKLDALAFRMNTVVSAYRLKALSQLGAIAEWRLKLQ